MVTSSTADGTKKKKTKKKKKQPSQEADAEKFTSMTPMAEFAAVTHDKAVAEAKHRISAYLKKGGGAVRGTRQPPSKAGKAAAAVVVEDGRYTWKNGQMLHGNVVALSEAPNPLAGPGAYEVRSCFDHELENAHVSQRKAMTGVRIAEYGREFCRSQRAAGQREAEAEQRREGGSLNDSYSKVRAGEGEGGLLNDGSYSSQAHQQSQAEERMQQAENAKRREQFRAQVGRWLVGTRHSTPIRILTNLPASCSIRTQRETDISRLAALRIAQGIRITE
jgi:hypothetical protein